MDSFWTWLQANWGEVAIAVVFVASVIVKFTPSTKDNKVLGVIINILDKLSVAKTADDKEVLKVARDKIGENEGK